MVKHFYPWIVGWRISFGRYGYQFSSPLNHCIRTTKQNYGWCLWGNSRTLPGHRKAISSDSTREIRSLAVRGLRCLPRVLVACHPQIYSTRLWLYVFMGLGWPSVCNLLERIHWFLYKSRSGACGPGGCALYNELNISERFCLNIWL